MPRTLFVFGLDTETERPNEVVTLVAVPKWDLGWLSTDTTEGVPIFERLWLAVLTKERGRRGN